MEDTQARLVFRAQMYIHNDIQNYQSKPQDFVNKIKKQASSEDENKSSVVLDANTPTTTATLAITDKDTSDANSLQSTRSNLLAEGSDEASGWYPTLQKTLWLLSKLYRCVQVGEPFRMRKPTN